MTFADALKELLTAYENAINVLTDAFKKIKDALEEDES